jgi:Flp pilus assembly protein TadG
MKSPGMDSSHRPTGRGGRRRRGAAAAELALLITPLSLLIVMAVDLTRVLYAFSTITNCARNGALYASDTTAAADSPYTDYKQAAMADGASLNPALSSAKISSASGSDSGGSWVSVTVAYDFPVLCGKFFGGSTFTISRTVTMRVAPATPG